MGFSLPRSKTRVMVLRRTSRGRGTSPLTRERVGALLHRMARPEPHGVARAIWRIESPKLIAVLVRLVRNVDLAEELAQDAFVEALERWAVSGIPEKPGAWLMT